MALGSRPVRPTRRRRRPWLLVGVFGTLVVLAVNAAMSARSPAPARQLAQQSYLDQALPAIQQSTQQGRDINAVRSQALTLSTATIVSHINAVVASTERTLAAVQKLDPPPAVKTAHALLVASLDLRYEGTKALGQAIGTALSGQPIDAGVQALTSAGLDLQAGDRAYSLFATAMSAAGTVLPESRWVSDANAYTAASLSVFVASLRSQGSLAPVHDVMVVLAMTSPQPVNLQAGLQILPITKLMGVQIVVANVGNQPERNLTVSASIIPSAIGATQMVRDFVDLTPGQTRTVSLGGLRVAAGQATVLTVRIDPLLSETNVADNTKVITLQMQ